MSHPDLLKVLDTESPEDVEHWCANSAYEAVVILNVTVPRALSGNRAAAYTYVNTWRSLTESILAECNLEMPDLVENVDGRLSVVDQKGIAAPGSRFVLDVEALEAPFSTWVARASEVGIGTCAALIQKLRGTIPRFRAIQLGTEEIPHWEFSEAQLRAFRRNVSAALAETDPELERIQQIFRLSNTELGELFGVTRQGATHWLRMGVPDDRLEKVAVVASVADLLDAQLRSERIPGIVRRGAESYDGLTALQMIKQDRHNELLSKVQVSFDWARPA